jgi:hypothetical protein
MCAACAWFKASVSYVCIRCMASIANQNGSMFLLSGVPAAAIRSQLGLLCTIACVGCCTLLGVDVVADVSTPTCCDDMYPYVACRS